MKTMVGADEPEGPHVAMPVVHATGGLVTGGLIFENGERVQLWDPASNTTRCTWLLRVTPKESPNE